MTANPEITVALATWIAAHPAPDAVLFSAGRTYTPRELAAGYDNGDEFATNFVQFGIDEIGVDNFATMLH